jgi:hypothetical protein
MGNKNNCTCRFVKGSLKERDHKEEPDIDGRLISQQFLERINRLISFVTILTA